MCSNVLCSNIIKFLEINYVYIETRSLNQTPKYGYMMNVEKEDYIIRIMFQYEK